MVDLAAAARVVAAFEQAIGELSLDAVQSAAKWWNGLSDVGAAPDVFASHLAEKWNQGAVLGVAFYRLLRALHLGATVASPVKYHRNRGLTVGDLVREFNEASGVKLNLGGLERQPIGVEPSGHVRATDLRAVDLAAAKDALADRLEAARARGGPRESDAAYAAGVAQQATVGGARTMVEASGSADKGLRGWVRVSGSGRPCAFCAMLLSRGAVYKSKQTATTAKKPRADGTTGYHPNCKCYSLPVFANTDLKSSKFALNRELHDVWHGEFSGKGLKGREGWRSFFYKKYGR